MILVKSNVSLWVPVVMIDQLFMCFYLKNAILPLWNLLSLMFVYFEMKILDIILEINKLSQKFYVSFNFI